MIMKRWLRLIAGALVVASLGLSLVHSPYWLILTGVVGFNLCQAMFIKW